MSRTAPKNPTPAARSCSRPYVKIKGQDAEDETIDPYQIPDGFFGRPPIDRIKVSLAGPLANIVLAFVAFGLLWMVGGRDKSFSDSLPKLVGSILNPIYFKMSATWR